MSDNTGIEWTDATWNPIRGCSRVSEGCRHCYAERVAARFSGPGQPYEGLAVRKLRVVSDDEQTTVGRWTGAVRMVPEHLADPLRWRRPRRVFVNSMSDLFHESLTNEQIAAVFGVMAAAPRHTFQVLTKRAARMRAWFEWYEGTSGAGASPLAAIYAARDHVGALASRDHQFDPWPLPHVWLGVSVENQAAADERIPELLRTPAAVRWLSCEPLLGEVDFKRQCHAAGCDGECGHASPFAMLGDDSTGALIDWIVAGCESGPGARHCNVEWMRKMRDQLAAAQVPWFLKQAVRDDRVHDCSLDPPGPVLTIGPGSHRKAGGVIGLPYLDGVQHAALPEPAP